MNNILRSLKDAHKNIVSMAGLIGPESQSPQAVKDGYSLVVLHLEQLIQDYQNFSTNTAPICRDVWQQIIDALNRGHGTAIEKMIMRGLLDLRRG